MELNFTIDKYLTCAYYSTLDIVRAFNGRKEIQVCHVEPYDTHKVAVYDYDGHIHYLGKHEKLVGEIG